VPNCTPSAPRTLATNLTVTVCKFCESTLAYSSRPEYLAIVEEHHVCIAMRDFLDSKIVPD